MQEDGEVYVGLDTSKLKVSVALAEAGRDGEVRFFGDVESTPEADRALGGEARQAAPAARPSAMRPARPATGSTGRSPRSATTAPWSPPR